MDTLLILLMAVFFLWAGVACVHRPRRVLLFLLTFFARASGNPALVEAWTDNAMLIAFVRLLGILSLINFVLQLYLLTATPVVA